MSDGFDPYHKWLGILPEEQPADLYRLLGIALFENDPDVIESAADRQASHLRSFQSGKQSAASQKLLNEVSKARVTLLNPAEKAAYDESLQAQMELAAQAATASADASPVPAMSAPVVDVPVFGGQPARGRQRVTIATRSTARSMSMVVGGIGVAVVLLLVIGVVAMNFGGDTAEPRPPLANVPAPPAPSSKLPKPATSPPKASTPAKSLTVNRSVPQAEAPAAETTVAAPLPSIEGLPPQLTVDLLGAETMEFVLIPAGEFVMGSTDGEQETVLAEETDKKMTAQIRSEGPTHRVRISRPFYLGKYEVTQGQWQAVIGDNPSSVQSSSNPVQKVDWEDIQPFLAKLNAAGTHRVPTAKTARADFEFSFALPTEAQWEYACRAGTTTAYCFGDDAALLPQYGWIAENAGGKYHLVGQAMPNAWGLYDMHGNVSEWCADWYGQDYYAESPVDDPTGPEMGSRRVIRGGGFTSHPGRARSAFRGESIRTGRYNFRGFRVALIPSAE